MKNSNVKLIALSFGILSLLCFQNATAQSLAQAFQKPEWSTYVFVSTTMPRQNLLRLARDSVRTKATLVLRGGYDAKDGGFSKIQKFVIEINEECCKDKAVSWVVDPKLFDRFQIKAAPSFVIALGAAVDPQSFALVTGDMEIPNALKFIAQQSKSAQARARAAQLYQSAFASE